MTGLATPSIAGEKKNVECVRKNYTPEADQAVLSLKELIFHPEPPAARWEHFSKNHAWLGNRQRVSI